jgi:hypothetical protein
VLLQIYIYGYLNRIRSSRRLERKCRRNIELMWLTGLSVFGTRMFLLRTPGQYQTLAARTLMDFLVQQARSWASQQAA